MDSKFMLLTTKPPHGTQTECSHMLELISLDYQFFFKHSGKQSTSYSYQNEDTWTLCFKMPQNEK